MHSVPASNFHPMKHQLKALLPLCFCFLITFTSCKKQLNDNTSDNEAVAAAYSDDIEADATYADVYNSVAGVNADIALTSTDVGADTQLPDPLTSHCYTITITPLDLITFPKTVTIDFGTGCLCRDGKTRKGQIITVFTNSLRTSGSRATSTFDRYYVNNVHVEGTHIIENKSTSDTRIITRTVQDGKLTKPDGNSIAWNAVHTSTQTAGSGTPLYYWDDEFDITGNANGQNNRKGTLSTWSHLIEGPLHKKVTCKWFDKGTVKLSHNNIHDVILNYGDGTCDNQATVTFANYNKTITLP